MKSVFAVAMLLALAGCSAQHGQAATSPKPVSSAPHVFSGIGSSQNAVPVPAGANSADISITCGGQDGVVISVTVGVQDQPRSGRCPSTVELRSAAHGTLDVSVDFSGGAGRYVAQVRFSSQKFASDSRVAAQCTALSSAFSDTASARNGYPNGPLDLAGWQGLMASAGHKLKDVPDSGAIGTQLTTLTEWYGRTDLTPAEHESADVNGAFEIVNSLCLDNGTPLVISSQYGG
ncbi:MAG: hypothetical protein ABIO06_07810 [Pseudolysinimonas sp.]